MCFIRVIYFGTAFLTGPQVIKTLAVVIGKNPYWSTEATKNLLGRSVACDVHKFAKVDLVCLCEKQYRTESLDNYVKLLRGHCISERFTGPYRNIPAGVVELGALTRTSVHCACS